MHFADRVMSGAVLFISSTLGHFCCCCTVLKQLVQGKYGSVVGGVIISNIFDNLKIVKVIIYI